MNRLRRAPDGPGPTSPPPDLAGAAHPSRELATRFLDAGSDDAQAARELRSFYAGQAADWSRWAESEPDYLTPLVHAFDLLSDRRPTLLLEVAAGSGQATSQAVQVADTVLATDVVEDMVREGARLVPTARWAVADAARLPVGDGVVDLLLCCNAVFAVCEAKRVVSRSGAILVVSSFAELTPIRHQPTALQERFSDWSLTWGRAGHGEWTLLERGDG